MTSAERIRAARTAKGMTQQELATALDVSARSVAAWEAGQTVPRDNITAKLEDVLGVSPDRPRTSPPLHIASDAELIAEQAARLADRDRQIAELTAVIELIEGSV